MTADIFSAKGRFFRGNLHTHTDRSDGILASAEVLRRYRAEGYDFLALTDHFLGRYGYPITDARAEAPKGLSLLLGAELHSGAMENGELWHLLAVGLPEGFAPGHAPDFRPVPGQESGAEIAARAREAGAFVAIAHPEWSGLSMADARLIEAAHAVEVYNHGCDVGADRGRGFHVLDALLSEGRALSLCATDDAHFNEPDHFGGWVMVKAEENAPEALLAALKAGSFYSTQGPELRGLYLEDTRLVVECSPAASIVLQGQGSAARAVHGVSMTRAEFALDRFAASPWLRATVIDRAGRRAWSNPLPGTMAARL